MSSGSSAEPLGPRDVALILATLATFHRPLSSLRKSPGTFGWSGTLPVRPLHILGPAHVQARNGMTPDWWQRGVIYQIYPRSFQDSNGDGVGDLAGILERLDYCAGLGVDAVWLSPVYPSPMADFGYDVSNYTDIHPLFGTLAQFDQFVSEAKRRDLKVILDFVPNHTSDQHPWFGTKSRMT